MSVLFQDDFNRADGGVGAAYTQITGNELQVLSNVATASAGQAACYPTGISITSGYVQAKIVTLPSSGGNGFGIGKLNGSLNGYVIAITDATTSAIRISNSGVGTNLGATFASPSANQVVRVERDDATGDVRVYYDGVLIATRNDTTYTGSGNCIVSFVTLASGSIDNFECGTDLTTLAPISGQAGKASNTGATTVSRAFPSNVTAGNLIVVACVRALVSGGSDAFVSTDCAKLSGTATIGTVALDVALNFDVGGSNFGQVGIFSAIVTGSGSLTMEMSNGASAYMAVKVACKIDPYCAVPVKAMRIAEIAQPRPRAVRRVRSTPAPEQKSSGQAEPAEVRCRGP